MLHNYGFSLISLGNFKDAVAILERARGLAPQNVPVLINLGYSYGKLKKYEKGIAVANEAIAADPTNCDARLLLGTLHLLNHDKDAAIAQQRTLESLDRDLGRRLFNAIHSDKILVVSYADKDRE
jgi:tetratricopeptide (TPR) repeat protein